MKHKAFTLIELMVVIAVVGVLAGLAVTSFHGSLGKATLDEAARELHATVRYARHYAVTHQRACRVVIDMNGGNEPSGYRIETESNDADSQDAFVAMQYGVGRRTVLPTRVRFAEVLIEGADLGADHILLFRETGDTQAAVIQLTDDRRTWSILIEPNTGKAVLVQDKVNQTPNMREDLDA